MGRYLDNVRGLHWLLNVIVGILVTLAGLAIMIFLLIVYGSLLTPHPLHATVVDTGIDGAVCPGDMIVTRIEIDLEEPANMQIDFTTTDANQEHIFLDSLQRPMYAVRARAAKYVQPFVWSIPHLPAAEYVQTMSLWPRGAGGDPVFLEMPFVIGESC